MRFVDSYTLATMEALSNLRVIIIEGALSIVVRK